MSEKKIYNVKTRSVAALERRARKSGVSVSVSVGGGSYAGGDSYAAVSGLLPRIEFDDMFEKVVTGVDADGNEIWYIHAKRSVASAGDFVGYKEDGSLSGGGGGGASALSELTDVLLTSPSIGDVLTWNGVKWVNAEAPSGGIDESALASYLTNHNYVTAGVLDGYVSGNYIKCAYGVPTLDWIWGSSLTHVAGFEGGNAGVMRVYNGDAVRNFANAVNRAGDTMTGPLNVAHNSTFCIINSQYNSAGNYTNVVWADVENNHVVYGSPFWSKVTLETSSDHIRRQTGANFYKIWDSGNDGSGSGLDADLLDGCHGSQYLLCSKYWDVNADNISNGVGFCYANGAPTYGPVVDFGCGIGYNLQFSAAYSTYWGETLHYRTHDGDTNTWNPWCQIARISDNVASATKLQTARNIWGQSFDGSGNVSGRFELDGNSYGCLSIFDGGTYRAIQSYDLKPLCLNTEGNNVGIYTANPRATLHVNGDMITNGDYFFQGYDGTLKIYSMPNPGQPAAYESETVVIQTAFDQQDPKTSYYPQSYPDRTVLALQPRGGRVGVGTAAPQAPLHVAGNILANGDVVGYNTSDRRLKTNVRTVNNALAMLRNLGGYYTFDYTADAPEEEKCERIGLIFQNVASSGHLGELMSHVADNGYGALNYIKADYINLIGASVLEVDDEVMRLKGRVSELENEVKQFKSIA